jgi:hypothetical protein
LEASRESSPLRIEEARAADPVMSEQRMTTIEDGMHDLKEMIKKQAEEIERMNK